MWRLEETAVVVYLFVIAFGAVRPCEIVPVTVAAGVLSLLWLWHARPRNL